MMRRVLRRISTTTRISLTLAFLTLSLVLAADALRLFPDALSAEVKGRQSLCEAVALQSSSAVVRGDLSAFQNGIRAIASRNPDILSAAVRTSDGKVLAEVGPHHQTWTLADGSPSTATQVRVPVFRDDKPWGSIEIRFREIGSGLAWGPLRYPLAKFGTFLFVAGLLAYRTYLRKVLQYLDPSLAIPERVRTMLDTLAEGVLVVDTDGRIVLANEAFARATDRRPAELIGLPASRFGWSRPTTDRADEELPWLLAIRRGTVHTGVAISLQRPDGPRTFTVNAAPIHAGKSAVQGALVTFDDVTPIEKKNAQLQKMLSMLKRSRDEINRQNRELQSLAMTDPLTGCLNRRAFFGQFESQWSAARRYGHPLSCVMVDVDHFKKINDLHGHATGDQVLQRVAAVLRRLARDTDLVCRYGGEEFCILLHSTGATGAAEAAERFRRAIESEEPGGLRVTASLGFATLEHGAASPQELLNLADEALYAAKRSGRNRVVPWSPHLPAAPPEEKHLQAPASAGHAAAPGHPIPFHAVTALLSALTHRDKGTALHSQRVADLCVATAEGLLPASDCFLLEVAALLHDIGKLGVPDSILLKPGPLTDEEWKVMRAHDRLGAEIVASAFDSPPLAEIVRAHHAQYGGTEAGGPARGAAGDAIPLAARVLSIADAYDAMTSDRPYRKGRGRDQAFAELRRCAGTQFDPALVERFIGVVEARAGRVRHAPTAVEQAMAGVQQELERLAGALDAQDLSLLAAMAGRLAASAHRDGLTKVSQLADEIHRCSSGHPDVLRVVDTLNELMQLFAREGSGTAAGRLLETPGAATAPTR